MKNTNLIEIFPPEHRDLIHRYTTTLPKVFDNYDVAIFMARKAVCFYKALVLGDFVKKPESCEILTNRALTYNIFEKLKNKKVVVIDDVKIKGTSINKTLKILSENEIKADVYLMAQTIDEEPVLEKTKIIETFAELSENDTKQLSKHIADFIAASICPYNIDQPIYNFRLFDIKQMDEFVNQFNLVDISSGLQKKYGIKNYILEIPNASFSDETLGSFISMCKIRFLYGEYKGKAIFLATPFILFDEMNDSELNQAFSRLDNPQLQYFIRNDNEKIILENKIKILSYVISAQLMDTFLEKHKIKGVQRLDSNDSFVFFSDILAMINCAKSPFSFTASLCNPEISYDYTFIRNEYLQLTYDFLYSEHMKQPNYCDSEGNPKPEDPSFPLELLILSDLRDYITERIDSEFNTLIFSSIIDVLIDTGVMIPTIVHHRHNNTIIRAYKGGEVYALNEEHFKLFTYTLNEYLKRLTHDDLGKVEFEKLCVMFFGTAVEKKILGYSEASDTDDTYSICYSKFGPRVSTSRRKYEAGESSSLASKLLNIAYIDTDEIKIEKGKVDNAEDNLATNKLSDDATPESEKYKVESRYTVVNFGTKDINDIYWTRVADRFARRFSQIYKHLFDENTGEIIFSEVRNMYLYSYPELLTLMAIGLNKKEQLLSLLAEVHLFNEKKLIKDIHYILVQHHKILDGLVSGMWKYMCYAQQFKEETKRFKPNHPIITMTEKLKARGDESSITIQEFIEELIDMNRNIDLNPHIEPLLHKAGNLIYSAAYAIWFMSKKYGVSQSISGKRLNLELHRKREFYFDDFDMDTIRGAIEDQVSSNTVEQNISLLHGLKATSKEILQEYHDKIAEGSKQEETKQIVVHGDYVAGNKYTIFTFQNEAHRSILNTDLDKLIKQLSDGGDKKAISDAKDALKSNDESKVIAALKGLGSVAKSVLTKIASELIVAYLKQNDVI